MTIEEKAKAYDEAIEKAKIWQEHLYDVNDKDYADELNYIFPGLKENRDERIREYIIKYFEESKNELSEGFKWNGITVEECIAWLEKQGEQREQLINKACGLLVNCIEDFMLRRMEIWNEECKKQTLENIRKKLEE